MTNKTTLATEDDVDEPLEGQGPVFGLVLVRHPELRAIGLAEGEVAFGRGEDADVQIDDERLSRRHASISRRGERITIRDLASRNGTYVDGERLTAPLEVSGRHPSVVRFGSTLAFFVDDVSPYVDGVVTTDRDVIVGPRLRRTLSAIEGFARSERCIHLVGETGVGKEVGARTYHAALGDGRRPFVALNCAAVPSTIAERLLFGAKRGTYSGAHSDAEGYIQAADGGTLFLDEIAELDLALQAKLLRVLESGEVTQLGATRSTRVEMHLCTATNADLRERVAAGAFRGDLYYRLGRPSVTIPPLRERREEIPFLVALALASFDPPLEVHPSFLDECARRTWPGNVRELLVEARCAAQLTVGGGQRVLRASALAEAAGRGMEAPAELPPPSSTARRGEDCSPEEIDRALEACGGNVSEAARRLGVHRTTLRRLLDKRRLAPSL